MTGDGKMLMKFWRALGLGVIALAAASPAGAVTYSFDNYIGQTNDFSIVSGGSTATFTSSSGPGTFVVNPSTDFFTFPVALGDFGNFTSDPLTITFSDPVVDEIIIPFGVFEAFAPESVTLVAQADTGQTGTFTTAFNNLITGSPEGIVTFVPVGSVRSLTLLRAATSTDTFAFAIGSVDVPEPMSAALLGGGLMALAATRRRRG